MQNKNILNAMFLPWRAGTELAFVNYSQSLQHLGYNVYSLIHPEAEIKKDLMKFSNQIIESKKIGRGRHDFFAIRYYRNLIKKHKIDVVIVHQGRLAVMFDKACKGIAKLVTVNHSQNPKHSLTADAAIVLSNRKLEQLKALTYPTKQIFYIQNRHNLREVPMFKERSVDSTLGLGFYGRFTEQKAPEILLEVAKELKERNVDFKFYIGGGGELESELRNKILEYKLENKVEMLGWIKNHREFYDRVDIFVMPSRWEQNPLTLTEAFAYSTPVVASKVEGIEDMIEDGKTGILCEVDNAKNIADKIISLQNSPALYAQIAKNAYAEIAKKYAKDVFESKLVKVLESVA